MGFFAAVGVTVLGIIGFAATGPVGGSLAALIQSGIYGAAVPAGAGLHGLRPQPWLHPPPDNDSHSVFKLNILIDYLSQMKILQFIHSHADTNICRRITFDKLSFI